MIRRPQQRKITLKPDSVGALPHLYGEVEKGRPFGQATALAGE